ncbi:hypothetical protein [Breoghania sp. L-A4]|uniref:c-type cytochrome n=1 Tax=Breoghania sp. L-A4 TaxID=2304600 RepID=UPI001967245D|nr:hypothetical protein [Breoghania sp. L-A4]
MNRRVRGRLPGAALLMGILALWGTVAPAHSDDAVARGRVVVEQWCRDCHLRAGDRPDPDMAPPYEQIVLRPGRDRAYFTRFLREDHFPMTTFRLFDQEKADVVAYLMSLREAARRGAGPGTAR